MRRGWLGWLVGVVVVVLPVGGVQALGENYVAPPFRQYYLHHDGFRILGPSLSGLRIVNGVPAQEFEKGRVEDHRGEVADPSWQLMYGRLTTELIDRAPAYPVNGTNISYADLGRAADPANRHAPPAGFTHGTLPLAEGVFIPVDPELDAAPGFIVPLVFWVSV